MNINQNISISFGNKAFKMPSLAECAAGVKKAVAGHTHKNMQLVQGKSQMEKARQISKTLGFFTAARYMAKRGYSLECARNILLGV